MESDSLSKYDNQYSLTIRFNSEGFTLFVYDENNILLTTNTISEKINSLSENELSALLTTHLKMRFVYKNTRIICETNSFTIIPAPFFIPEHAVDFLDFEQLKQKGEAVLFNHLPSFNAVNIFSLPAAFYKSLASLFPYCNPEHHISFLLNEQIYKSSDKIVHVQIRVGWMDILVLVGNNLQFVNRFEFRSPEDFLYYILHVYELLNLEPENSPVVFYNSSKNPVLKNLLEKYVEVIDK